MAKDKCDEEAQKCNGGDLVRKKLFEDDEIHTDTQHAAASKPDRLICLEGMVETKTRTLRDALVSGRAHREVGGVRRQGARGDQQEVRHRERERIGEVSKQSEVRHGQLGGEVEVT